MSAAAQWWPTTTLRRSGWVLRMQGIHISHYLTEMSSNITCTARVWVTKSSSCYWSCLEWDLLAWQGHWRIQGLYQFLCKRPCRPSFITPEEYDNACWSVIPGNDGPQIIQSLTVNGRALTSTSRQRELRRYNFLGSLVTSLPPSVAVAGIFHRSSSNETNNKQPPQNK